MKLHFQSVAARHPASAKDGAPALSGAQVMLNAGEHIALIGPSGAGKTTWLHTAACALKPDSGSLELNGTNPWRIPASQLQALRRQICLAPQVPPLPPRQRVVTSVLAGALPQMGLLRSMRSLFYPVDMAGAHRALQAFDLSEKLFDRVDRLSGGERQRVGLARLLMSSASLWLVDEPLSALDPTRATQAIQTLVQQARERDATLVCTLHQVDRALAYFPRIIGLREGKTVFDLPSTQVTAELLAQLYAQHEYELQGHGTPVANFDAMTTPTPAVMYCR